MRTQHLGHPFQPGAAPELEQQDVVILEDTPGEDKPAVESLDVKPKKKTAKKKP